MDEEIAWRVYEGRRDRLPTTWARVRAGLDAVRAWVAREPRVEWVEPDGGAVCFPRIRADFPVDLDRFYATLRERHATRVGPGHWFEMDRRHMRIGYGWPEPGELRRGLESVSRALDAAAV